eukprot:TRINITY_DN5930_c0_g3_i1.p1 TRINITY_DN5930_c0_g3~~TRINITY_DN5930_c0_g3_i1.p1  ORF type:complete len:274 (-),score=32.12 TRINITY_DN5930_c0_g3_i1:459-1280(-)
MDTRLHSKVVHFLDTVAVARWQAVDVSTKKSFEVAEGSNVWLTCAEYERSEMVANRALYEGEHRTAILRCHALCRRSNYAMMPALAIDNIEEASQLTRQLRVAHRACKAHKVVSGLDAQVLLGVFDLSESSRGTMFRCGADGRPSILGLPPGVLEVNRMLDGRRTLMASSRYTTDIAEQFTPHAHANRLLAVVDVASADHEMTLLFRGMQLTLDGSWSTSMIGSVASAGGSGEHSGRAVLCVLTVMEGGYTKNDVSLLRALNVDVVRGSRPTS